MVLCSAHFTSDHSLHCATHVSGERPFALPGGGGERASTRKGSLNAVVGTPHGFAGDHLSGTESPAASMIHSGRM